MGRVPGFAGLKEYRVEAVSSHVELHSQKVVVVFKETDTFRQSETYALKFKVQDLYDFAKKKAIDFFLNN